MQRWHWFQWVSGGVLLVFFAVLLMVIVSAYTRHSGTTNLDMATMQKIRFEANGS